MANSSFRKEDFFPMSWDGVGLPAPAGPGNSIQTEKTIQFLIGLGLRVIKGKSLGAGDELSYLSAPASARADDFNQLIRNPRIQAIYCLRGGFGSAHLLDALDWDELKKRRLPVIGYSDITALHMAMTVKRAGIPVAACMALNLPREAVNETFQRHFLRACLAAEHPGKGRFGKIATLRRLRGDPEETIAAPLLCANLTVLTSLCGTAYQPSARGRLLVLEDIGEPVRKIDRALTQLRMAGILNGCAGVIFGNFLRCGPIREREILLRRFAAESTAPVYEGLRFGHCEHSLPLVCGETARLQNAALFVRDPGTFRN